MTARDSQLTGRLRLRHLLEVTEAANEEMIEERPRFVRLAKNEAAPRVVSAFNLFQTPPALAARVVELLGPIGRTLEPSAGLGRIYHAIRQVSPKADVTLVEQSPECCAELYRQTEGDAHAELVQGDFLALSADRLGLFDSIAMNPPFKMGTDVKHIRHAMTLLAPGGRLVSLCANGPKQRAALQCIAQEWIELPADSFKSEGTRVDAAIFVF
jgi:SAM-dependent methyltransferase